MGRRGKSTNKRKRDEVDESAGAADDEQSGAALLLSRVGLDARSLDALHGLTGDLTTEARLEAQADYFDSKLALVPPKAYKEVPVDPDAWKKVKSRKGKQGAPASKKAAKPAAAPAPHTGPSKSALRKFNPAARLTLPEMIDLGRLSNGGAADGDAAADAPQQESQRPLQRQRPQSRPPRPTPTAEGATTAPEGDAAVNGAAAATDDGGGHSHAAYGDDDATPDAGSMSRMATELGFVPGTRAKNPTELKQRMALVREWFKNKRPGAHRPANPYLGSKPQSDASNVVVVDGNEGASKKRAKEKKKDKKDKKSNKKSNKKVKGDASANGTGTATGAAAAAVAGAPTEVGSPQTGAAVDVNFGRFDFGTGKPLPLRMEAKKRKSSDVELLKKAEQERLNEREALQSGVGLEEIEDKQWGKMMVKATGGKVRDDPKLLAKTVKQKEKQKNKSRSEWATRTKQLEEAKVAKQADYLERQKKNISRKHFGKRGSMAQPKGGKGGRAGFEGRKKKLN